MELVGEDVATLLLDDIIANLELALISTTKYFFVDIDMFNLELLEEVGRLDLISLNLESMICFLTLSTTIKNPT